MEHSYDPIDALLRRVGLFLEDGDWVCADRYCERILDMDPENARAYTGKLFAKLQARDSRQFLEIAASRLEEVLQDPNTQKVLRFGTEQEKQIFQQIMAAAQKTQQNQQQQRLSDTVRCVQRGHFDVANANFAYLYKDFSRNYQYHFWKLLNDYQSPSPAALVSKGIPIQNSRHYANAMKNADPEQAASLQALARQTLFQTGVNFVLRLTQRDFPRTVAANWLEMYLYNCPGDDPCCGIYQGMKDAGAENWSDPLVIGALLHLHSIWQTHPQTTPYALALLEQAIRKLLEDQKQALLIPAQPEANPCPGTIRLKALKNPAPRPNGPAWDRDYTGQLQYRWYRKKSQESIRRFCAQQAGQTPGPSNRGVPIQNWCEPDLLWRQLSRSRPQTQLPEAVAAQEPREAWQRYVYMAQRIPDQEALYFCAQRVKALAPQEFPRQIALRDRLLNYHAGRTDYIQETTLNLVWELYPQDSRAVYPRLRQLTKDFEPPKRYDQPYQCLAESLPLAGKRDRISPEALDEKYRALEQEISQYIAPFWQAAQESAVFLSGWMLEKWNLWWLPLEQEANQLLLRIRQDRKVLEQKIQKSQQKRHWFGS